MTSKEVVWGFNSSVGNKTKTKPICISIVYFRDEALPDNISHLEFVTYNRPLNCLRDESAHK